LWLTQFLMQCQRQYPRQVRHQLGSQRLVLGLLGLGEQRYRQLGSQQRGSQQLGNRQLVQRANRQRANRQRANRLLENQEHLEILRRLGSRQLGWQLGMRTQ
jgi:hypothetical protein